MHLLIAVFALFPPVSCTSSSDSTCLSKHNTSKLNTDLDGLNHKWTRLGKNVVEAFTKSNFTESSSILDEISTQLQDAKALDTSAPCSKDDQDTVSDRASTLMDTIKSHLSDFLYPLGDESKDESKSGKSKSGKSRSDALDEKQEDGTYTVDTGGYQYQGGAASAYIPYGSNPPSSQNGGGDYAQPQYGQNPAYPPSNQQQPNYQQPNYQQQPNYYQQEPYYQQPAPRPSRQTNPAPALNDQQGNFVIRFAERLTETVLYQLEVIGVVFSRQKNTKSLDTLADVRSKVSSYASKFKL